MRSERPIQRFLVVRNDRIGDLVMTLPAFEAARKALPHAHLSALVNPRLAPLLNGYPHLDEVLPDRTGESAWALGRRLRALKFDAVAVIFTSTRNCLAVWHARIPLRACWGYKPAGLLFGNRRVFLHRSRPPIHESAFALAFIHRLVPAAQRPAAGPRLVINPAVRERVAERIRRDLGATGSLFGINPGCGGSAFPWPVDRFTELAGRLAERGRVLVTGGPGEEPLLERMKSGLSEQARGRVAFYPEFDLVELAAAIREVDVYTAPSTGPLHLAGAVGTPIVGLFSPHPAQTPAKWGPFGEHNVILEAPLLDGEDPRVPKEKSAEHMARITVDQVVDANLRCLGRVGATQ